MTFSITKYCLFDTSDDDHFLSILIGDLVESQENHVSKYMNRILCSAERWLNEQDMKIVDRIVVVFAIHEIVKNIKYLYNKYLGAKFVHNLTCKKYFLQKGKQKLPIFN